MKSLKMKFIATSILTTLMATSAQAGIGDFLEKSEIREKVREEIADLDINFSAGLGSIDVVEGMNIAAKYRYEVEASYQDQYYTRVDKWDLKTGINVGDLVKDFVDVPFSFSMERKNSFVFVRQFSEKKAAIKARPYTPKRLPLSANLALKNLAPGDFVSMPANINIAVSAGTSTSTVAPVILSSSASVYYVMSGEFIIQVFKIDESHVRLKMISARGYNRGASASAGVSFEVFGISVLDKQIDRLFDRDLLQLGYVINPGAQFIVDYVFDLNSSEARDAYNQILKTSYKFKDVVVLNKLHGASELKDKLIASYEKAEKIFEQDKLKAPKDRRVSRIFKGFNDKDGHTKKMKMALLLTSFTKENAYTENKVTYIDKNENNLEFFYPTFSKYMETKTGKWIFDFKDQAYQTNFGLIPRLNAEDTLAKNPDYGVTFERRDKYFGSMEQRYVQKFLIDQIPAEIRKDIDLSEWKDGLAKTDSRIFLQVILKAQGFEYLKTYSREDLQKRLLEFFDEKSKVHVLDKSENAYEQLKNFLFINRYVKEARLKSLATDLYNIFKNEEENSEIMLKKLVKLNEYGIFDKIGVGFLISLLPQDQLQDLVYLKLEMSALDHKEIAFTYGTLKYRALYQELTVAQSRIANRSYDLRLKKEDHEMESGNHTPGVEEIVGLK